jgi:U3 small nucleolar RNA-associated protein 5
MIGPFDSEGKKRPRTSGDSEPVMNGVPSSSAAKEPKSKKSKKDDSIPSEVIDGAVVSSSRGGEDDVLLGKRLEQLSRQMAALEQARDRDYAKGTEKGLSADSLVTLLDQALQSGDAALLDRCLNCTDLDIIDTTTKLLSTHRVLKFLKVLVGKFEKNPSRGILVARWISRILKNHLSYLITVPDLSTQLAGLNQMLEQRLQAYTRLSSLAGRLDLLMSQISSKTNAGHSDYSQENLQPKAVYQD